MSRSIFAGFCFSGTGFEMERLNQMKPDDLYMWIKDCGLPEEVVQSFRGGFVYTAYGCIILCGHTISNHSRDFFPRLAL